MKNISKSGLKVKSNVKAGGMIAINHNRVGLKVRSAVKGGFSTLQSNHNVRQFAAR